jgi:hypothetical protein
MDRIDDVVFCVNDIIPKLTFLFHLFNSIFSLVFKNKNIYHKSYIILFGEVVEYIFHTVLINQAGS